MSINEGTINLIATAFRDLGVTLPKSYLKALQEIEADRERLNTVRGRDVTALADGLLAALKSGVDPADSEDVRRELARLQLHESLVVDRARLRLNERTAETLSDHAGKLIEAMSDVLDGVDAELAKAREVLPGNVDLADPSSATRVKPQDLQLWAAARAGLETVDRIAQTWKLISNGLGHPWGDRRFTPLVVAELSADQLAELGSHPTAKAAGLAGHSLSLATFETFAERTARIIDDLQAAEDTRPTFADTYRRTRGIGQAFKVPS